MKLEKIRDWDGDVAGYKLGDYELVKHYYYGNQYSWRIEHKDYKNFKGNYFEAIDSKLIEEVSDCKSGKKRLVELVG